MESGELRLNFWYRGSPVNCFASWLLQETANLLLQASVIQLRSNSKPWVFGTLQDEKCRAWKCGNVVL